MTLLLVEKSALLTERLLSLLGDIKERTAIYTCSSYFETKCLLDDITPDIVILDAGLPCKSSTVLYRMIKAVNKKTAFIILLNRAADPAPEKLRYRTAMHIFDKYDDCEKIAPALQKIMDKKQKSHHHEQKHFCYQSAG